MEIKNHRTLSLRSDNTIAVGRKNKAAKVYQNVTLSSKKRVQAVLNEYKDRERISVCVYDDGTFGAFRSFFTWAEA